MLSDAVQSWIGRWLRLADGDLAMARVAMANDDFEVFELVGFHAQQAVEKGVKAYLVRHSIEFGDTHDIDMLVSYVRTVDGTLAAKLDPAVTLTRYAVGTRYPGRYANVSREQGEAAVRIAENVRAEILPLITRDGPPPPPSSLRERLRRQRESRS